MEEKNSRILQFFLEEKSKFYSYIRGKINDISYMDIEDIIEDVMINIFVKSDVSVYIENLAAYIYRSINNKIIDYQRKNKNLASLESFIEEGIMLMDIIPDHRDNVENEVKRKEMTKRLYQAIDSLETKQRAVWIATKIEGRSFKELSDLWDEPIGTLLSRKSRAAKFLQKQLKDLKNDF
jgi:RNA polymerase sigma factor (sigma-70 family)